MIAHGLKRGKQLHVGGVIGVRSIVTFSVAFYGEEQASLHIDHEQARRVWSYLDDRFRFTAHSAGELLARMPRGVQPLQHKEKNRDAA